MSCYYGRKVIILLDEYDTPMQEAYVNGLWDELVNRFWWIRELGKSVSEGMDLPLKAKRY